MLFHKHFSQLFHNSTKSVSTKESKKADDSRLFIKRDIDGNYFLSPTLEGERWVQCCYVLFEGSTGKLSGIMVATNGSVVTAIEWTKRNLPDGFKVVCANHVPQFDWHDVRGLSSFEFAIQRARG